MRKILSILLFLPIIADGQQKISGTVTYYYNEYQGNKADVGATVYVFDSAAVDMSAINAIQDYMGAYRAYDHYITEKTYLQNREMEKRRRDRSDTLIFSKYILIDMDRYGLREDPSKLKRLDDSAATKEIRLLYTGKQITSKADGVGNYSINLKKPGVYYVIIQSANRERLLSKTFVLGNLYIEKVVIEPGDEKNVSTNIEM